ncbi:hypothetical protein DFQ28_009625 [Apophysomyces sp. BC1034]|nr:hypothetical protein DFQ30_001371 [Apophysomyces sp. BC1015]KAG0180428.1 hypothetical protein DFQ29_000674 [Apophysomyces sp. BC1021]KAG0185269.1 hypothetical protein DFQ28_009625 [Apophysomyces sp. BC1034]
MASSSIAGQVASVAANIDVMMTLNVLKTVLLAYVTHVATVRREQSTLMLPMLYKRLSSLAWPLCGVQEACGSIYKVWHGDKILGFHHIKQDQVSKAEEGEAQGGLDLGIAAVGSSSPTSHPLQILLKRIGRVKAKKIRSCILNHNMFLGTDTPLEHEHWSDVKFRSKDMAVCGPGARRRYQIPISPSMIEYLPKQLLEQLEEAHGIEDRSYVAKLVTLVQAGYSTYEILTGDGDRWSKVILGVYMSMSILQVASLFVLPSQFVAFSIGDPAENKEDGVTSSEKSVESSGEEISVMPPDICIACDKPHSRDGSQEDNADCGQRMWSLLVLRKAGVDTSLARLALDHSIMKKWSTGLGFRDQPRGWWKRGVYAGNVAIPLLFGIIAGYQDPSPAKWIVLAWIIANYPFTLILLYLDYSRDDRWCCCAFTIILFILPGIALIVAATVLGYIYN